MCIRVGRGLGEGFRARLGDGDRARLRWADDDRDRDEELLEREGDRDRDRESLEEPELDELRDDPLELLRDPLRLKYKERISFIVKPIAMDRPSTGSTGSA